MEKIHTFFDKTLFNRNNILFLFFLFLITCFLSRLNSNFFLIDILGQLGFQIFVSGIFLFFILLILKKFWASIIFIFICALFFADILLSCNRCNAVLKDVLPSNNKLRLMTINLFYDNPVSNFENIREMILYEKPDIIQFQEFSPQMIDKIKNLKSIFTYSTEINKHMSLFDSVILSKYPLINSSVENYNIIQTSLSVNETEIAVFGIHLNNQLSPKRFNLALKQMDYLKTLIENSNKNIILIGDLNMTSASRRFSNFLKETNLYTYTSYNNPTSTWPAFLPNFLGVQLEHVLFSKNFKLINKKTTNNFGSDHRPLIVDLAY